MNASTDGNAMYPQERRRTTRAGVHGLQDCAGPDCTVFGCDWSPLDLDADPPPPFLPGVRWLIQSIRFPATLAAWIRETAFREGKTFNGVVVDRLTRSRDTSRPADVDEWLLRQAAQCGCPGDTEQALVKVVRHLSARWPDGGRLR